MYSSPSSHDLAKQNRGRPEHVLGDFYFPFLASRLPLSFVESECNTSRLPCVEGGLNVWRI